ncbi:hypothetical protein [Agathobaculum desmolans]|uniref:hypothetical protein n=1 Tax=Agathobaculum desmolans TaxID=39484 RepID=UPI00248E8955|nr:hypothetical protein [Agathobaculum desmolans]
MKKRNYTHVQPLLSEIKTMVAEGKTQQQMGNRHFLYPHQAGRIHFYSYERT